MWDFKCFDPEGRDMCFNSGSCAVSNETGEEYCICPPGFTHDFDWFHFPNCVSNLNNSKYFFIQYAILASLLSLVLMKFIIFNFRSHARQIAGLAFGFVFCIIWFVLSFYLQGGCYESCAVISTISFMFGDYCLGLIIVVAMRPLFLIQNESFRMFQTAMWTWTHLVALGMVCSGVAMVVTCQNSNVAPFNAAAFSSTAFLWIGGISQVSFTLLTTFKLEQKLIQTTGAVVVSNNEARLNKSKSFIRRLRMLRVLMLFVLIPFSTLMISVPIILVHFSSFPHYYVIHYTEIEISLVFDLAVLLFLKQSNMNSANPKDRVHSSAVSSGRQKQPEQMVPQPLSPVALVEAQEENTVVNASENGAPA